MATPTPLFQILEQLLPPDLHRAVWQTCLDKRWYFGHQTNDQEPGIPFWKMDLENIVPIDQLWENARNVCETTVGAPLKVIRQYANGHTYGLGGRPHVDDTREGCYTLLYYPMPVWNVEWEGETLFFNSNGDVVGGVIPVPNRAVLFDSRMPHAGRAPSRHCPGLRVTVALKLELS